MVILKQFKSCGDIITELFKNNQNTGNFKNTSGFRFRKPNKCKSITVHLKKLQLHIKYIIHRIEILNNWGKCNSMPF